MSKRCEWAKTDLSIAYHDDEWGVPVHDDRTLFEFLVLEGAQAGLSWEIILKKRAGYREAFSGFDPAKVAKYDERRTAKLLENPNIVRNRLKIAAAINNAKAFLAVRQEFGSFDSYIWNFVNGEPRKRKRGQGVPATSVESDAMSKDLTRRGFKFVGSTICYAFMQAVGMVNDHDPDCFRYQTKKPSRRKKGHLMPKLATLIFSILALASSLSCSSYTTGLQQSVTRADEMAAVGALRAVSIAQQSYSLSNSGVFATFPELVAGGYLESRFNSESPQLKGYVLTMNVVPKSAGSAEDFFSCNADPAGTGPSSGRHFYVDSKSTEIKVNATQPATASDETFQP